MRSCCPRITAARMSCSESAASNVSWPKVPSSRSLPRLVHDFLQKRATEELSRARRLGIPLSQISGSPSGRNAHHGRNAGSSQRSLPVGAMSDLSANGAGDMDEEGGLTAVARKGNRLNMNKIAECREKSQSAWLHFPHVELVFLLFAFEGAVAAEVAAVRGSSSPIVVILAIIYLVRIFFRAGPAFAFKCAKLGLSFVKHSRPQSGNSIPYSS